MNARAVPPLGGQEVARGMQSSFLSETSIIAKGKTPMALELNQPAPDFTLFDTGKKKISLHDFQGKNVVLLFFPFAFSGTCTKQLCEMRDNYSYYSDMNAEVIGISVDSLYTNAKYK